MAAAGLATALCASSALGAPCDEPRALTVERLENPCGVDASSPRFGWKLAVTEKGKNCVVQSAYRILVASSKEKLAADKGDLWDSGKVSGADTIDVEYGGKPLASSCRYWWKVRTWDGVGKESAWSAPATWVTGILPPDGWKAKWIGPAPETRPDADLAGARWITAKPNARGDVVISLDFDFAGARVLAASLAVRAPGGAVSAITPRELALLRLFAAHPGQVLARDFLLNAVWGVAYYGTTRTLDQHVANLRRKLGAAARALETVRGAGYRLAAR